MRQVYAASSGRLLGLGNVFDKGGEAAIHELPGDQALVAKVYSDQARAAAAAPRVERLAKASGRLRQESQAFRERILLPQDLLLSPATRMPIGFTMRRATGRDLRTLYRWFHPKENPNPHTAMQMYRYARNVASLVNQVHRVGLRVADLNSTNFLATKTGAVFLIDTDSFAIPEGGADVARPPLNCPVGKAEFLPPELQGVSLVDARRGERQDCWSLAVLLFLLFARGTHPFDGTDETGRLPTQQGARMTVSGAFPYAGRGGLITPPRRGFEAWRALPSEVRSLMIRAFVDGHAEPSRRPPASEWISVLDQCLQRGFRYCRDGHSFPTWTHRSVEACSDPCRKALGYWSTIRCEPAPDKKVPSTLPPPSYRHPGQTGSQSAGTAVRPPVPPHPQTAARPTLSPSPLHLPAGLGPSGATTGSSYSQRSGGVSGFVEDTSVLLLTAAACIIGFATGVALSLTFAYTMLHFIAFAAAALTT